MENEAKTKVLYEDFGAVGDGVTDDFFAIKRAHDYANENLLAVGGTKGKTYRIHDIVGDGEKASYISIKTDTDWEGVNFIIDDRGYHHSDKNNAGVFKIESDYPQISLTEREDIERIFPTRKLEAGFAGKINWSDFGYEALLVIKNDNTRNYIRSGIEGRGQPQSELIVVDKDGQVRAGTELLFAYDDITRVNIFRADERHITVKGGYFTHIANDTPMQKEDWRYFSRSITIARSYTTVDGLSHIMTGELPGINEKDNTDPKGPPYSGFLLTVCATDVSLLNCTLTAKRVSGIAGTYDFQAGTANNLYLYNVRQSNYYKEDGVTPTMDYRHYWGIGGTNYCKNLTYDTCLMSRYDAHCGVYNGKVINSTVCNMELIGGGDMLIENTTFTPISFAPIMLRWDYGCTWKGNITVKNCTVKNPTVPITTFMLFDWKNKYFGYDCTMPNMIIDNMTWEIPDKEVKLFDYSNTEEVSSDTLRDGTKNLNKRIPAEYVRVINNKQGITYNMYDTPHFRDTLLEGITLIKPEEKTN